MTSISQAIVRLLEKEMFYGELISQMRRIVDNKFPVVAGVCIKDNIELHINEKRFNELPLNERTGVLKHECEHILRDHIGRMKELCPEVFKKTEEIAENIIKNQKFKAMNIAADLAINGQIQDIPEWACFPKNFDLPNGETTEWYLEQLKDNEKMKDCNEFDCHSIWGESDENKETLKEKIRQAINKAAKKTRAAGRMTAEHELIVSTFNTNTLNWKQQLARFAARSLSAKVEDSRKKRNRRYGIKVPGSVKTEELHIGVAIDTSGSVSDRSLQQFMAEIEKMSRYAKITVVEADSEIKNAYEFKKKKEYALSGRGGTAYQPAFDYFNKIKDIDGVVYFGDMDSSDTPKKPKYKVLWAIIGTQTPPASFGGKIYITED